MPRFNRFLLFSILALLLMTTGSTAQPSLCTISGTLYDSTGSACSNCKLTISRARQGSTPLNAPPVEKRADSNGAVSFTAVQGSFVTLTGTFSIGRYNFATGLEMYIPLQSSTTLTALQTAEDALNALISTTTYAPADIPVITKTANGSLSNEFALGSLATGLLKNTTTTGVPTIAVAGTDYESPLTFAARLNRSTNTIDLAASGVTAGSCTACDLTIDTYGRVTAKANGSGGGGTVSSVFGRSGAVVAATNDYTFAQIDKTTSSLADLTTRSASDLSSGTLPDGRFPATLPAASGINLTALNASSLASGTVPLARLSGITTAELSATAGITNGQLAGSIAYSKLSLTDSIVNADINSAAAIAYSKLNLTGAILNADLAGSIANNKLANSAITIAGNSTSLGGSISLDTIDNGLAATGLIARIAANTRAARTITGTSNQITVTNGDGVSGNPTLATPQDIGTSSNVRFGNFGLGVASPTSGGQISSTLGANNITGLLIKRNTDTSPTGKFFDFQNAAGTTVASMGVDGGLTVASCTGCGGASFANPSASVGLTAVNGSASTAMRSDAAPALDQSITPTWTGQHIFSKNGALSSSTGPGISATGTWITGGSATTTKPYVLIETSGATSTGWSTSGTGLGVNAATGFTGNLIDLQLTGTQKFAVSSTGLTQSTKNGGYAIGVQASSQNFVGIGRNASIGGLNLNGGTGTDSDSAAMMHVGTTGVTFDATFAVGWASSNVTQAKDVNLQRPGQAATVRVQGSSSTTAATFSTPALSPAQITADQNNYNPGTGWFQRWSSDASRNITGLVAGVDGQIIEIWNIGSQNIVLQNENASSTAANRFTTSTGADLTLAASKCAKARYDATSARWRAYLCN